MALTALNSTAVTELGRNEDPPARRYQELLRALRAESADGVSTSKHTTSTAAELAWPAITTTPTITGGVLKGSPAAVAAGNQAERCGASKTRAKSEHCQMYNHSPCTRCIRLLPPQMLPLALQVLPDDMSGAA
ncbi:hypothetical protein JKP88DRAFT_250851 [Tribonema minus]|uniref:Uncharacterized protein n=1 Tax=Tribonema minus TaxID=303371 RepID=A0A836CQV9_9STRA|nr:hypothetical protein JKP88DRAFT_250851 [Tribonema minus]